MSEPRCARCGMPAPKGLHPYNEGCIVALGAAVRALQASRQSIYRVRPSMDPDRLDSKGRLKDEPCVEIPQESTHPPEPSRLEAVARKIMAEAPTRVTCGEWGGVTIAEMLREALRDASGAPAPRKSGSAPDHEPAKRADSEAQEPLIAPEPPATERKRDELDEIERLVDHVGRMAYKAGRWEGHASGQGYAFQHAKDRDALLDAIRARLRAPQGEPDPDRMEAWADWYDEHMDVGVRVGPDAFYHAGDVLRRLATDHRREERVERARGAGGVFRAVAARAHRDATGDTP